MLFRSALGVVAGILAIHELCTIARDHRPVVLAAYLGVLLMIVLAHVRGVEGMVLALGPVVLLTFILAAAAPREDHSSLTSMAVTVFGVVWIGVGLGSVVVLRDGGFSLVLAVLLGTWASDIGAYAIGRLIGHHAALKLAAQELARQKERTEAFDALKAANEATEKARAAEWAWQRRLEGILSISSEAIIAISESGDRKSTRLNSSH